MVSRALYRKYRSKSLAEVVGQDHITDILSRALKAGRIAHAYLFTGPRGVGKTSIARILAHEINKLPYTDDSAHLDIIEIDAASNNGVEDVRDLREKVQIAPVSAEKKVYIIDEVHMLSKPAFNALLKTLEEPPEHIVFILATTDVEKLPATIVSRTQRFSFRAISPEAAITHLKHIASEEKIKISDDALALIAERGDGSFRDSISLLDQLASLADTKEGITVELIETALGLAPLKVVHELIEAVTAHDVPKLAQLVTTTEAGGTSALVLTSQLVGALRERVVESPQLFTLLDALLDVPKSTHPYMKLLSVLGSAALVNKPAKTAALSAPTLEVSATIEELSQQATKKHPRMKKPVASETESDSVRTSLTHTLQPDSGSAGLPDTAAGVKPLAKGSAEDVAFSWEKLVDHTREHFVAVYSVLSKCGYDLQGNDLTIYAVNTFYKKKLDDPKYSSHLYESLQTLGNSSLTIHTVPTRAPIKDSQAAAVADIMGGGIEVAPDAA